MTERSRARRIGGARLVAGMTAGLLGLVGWMAGAPLAAQDVADGASGEAPAEETGWSGSGELGVVATSGNTDTSSVSGRLHAEREWVSGTLRLDASALRADQTNTAVRAVGATPDDVTIVETSDTETTAEQYAAGGQYDRELTERLFAFASAGWQRDELAGIDARWTIGTGVGNVWVDREDLESRTSYGVTYTREDGTSGIDQDFAGARFTWDHRQELTGTTTYTHALEVNENLDDTDDLRADLLASIAVAMTERLALKVSGELKYDHQPAFRAVPRELPDGTPAGDSVLVELDDLDTILSAALVVKF